MVKKKKKNLKRRFLIENIGVIPRDVGTMSGGFSLKPFDDIKCLAYKHKFPVVALQTTDHLMPFWNLGHS